MVCSNSIQSTFAHPTIQWQYLWGIIICRSLLSNIGCTFSSKDAQMAQRLGKHIVNSSTAHSLPTKLRVTARHHQLEYEAMRFERQR
eukprot:c25417_g1_i1 orf=33-293(-)